jgi:hypothetical protein
VPCLHALPSNQADIDRRVKEVERKLAPDVAWIRYSLTLDFTGEDSIYFRVVCPIRRAAKGDCAPFTERVEGELAEVVGFDEFGLNLFFN